MKKLISSILLTVLAILFVIGCSKENSSASFDGTGLSGSTARFAISSNHLYTVDARNLNIFSLANPAQPSRLGNFPLGMDIETIFPYKSSLLIGSQSAVYIVDITQPSTPIMQGIVSHIRSCDPVVAENNIGFVTLSTSNTCTRGVNRLEVLDLSNLSAPKVLTTYPMSSPRGLGIDGKWLFVCDNGLKMYDKTNVNNLVKADEVQTVAANDLIASNNKLIVTAEDGIYQYDYSTSKMVFLSKILKSL